MASPTQRLEYIQTERGAVPVYADGLVTQPEHYDESEHKVWRTLLERQNKIVVNLAHLDFLRGLHDIGFGPRIPSFDEINAKLTPATGWRLVGVNGLLPDGLFFDLMKNKTFPVTWWIRKPDQIEYIQEPDLFHDIYGHVPMIFNQDYANLLELFGQIGSLDAVAKSPSYMIELARLYWFSVEFGLMSSPNGVRAFGAGLLSSIGEVSHALGDDPERKKMSMRQIVKTPYKIDAYQPVYFVADNIAHIEKCLKDFEGRVKYANTSY